MSRRLLTVIIVVGLAWGGLAAALATNTTPKLGLDLRGGTSVILRAPDGTAPDLVETAVEIMRRRIEDFGSVQEPEIAISGGTSVLVNLPGVTDQERALSAIGQTGELSFRPVFDANFISPLLLQQLQSEAAAAEPAEGADGETTDTSVAPSEDNGGDAEEGASEDGASEDGASEDGASEDGASEDGASEDGASEDGASEDGASEDGASEDGASEDGATEDDAPADSTTTTTPFVFPDGVDPDTGLTIADSVDAQVAWLPEYDGEGNVVQVYQVGTAALLGSDVADALAIFGGAGGFSGGWTVQLDLTDDGGDKFQAITAYLAGQPVGSPTRQLAIVLDGVVVAAPQVNTDVSPQTGIDGGQAVITLGGDEDEAQDLATVLRYGSLPVAFERSSVQKVSATLGADSLQAGLIAGLGGLLLVICFLLFYYRALGLVTLLGLTVFGSLLLLVFSLTGRYQGVTLTLAGVAGVIVSVGITADSYIVYFERIKEEIRKGRTVRDAAEVGFTRAFRTILTADFVSLMGATLLYVLAVGAVKGFALALGIATLLDVFVAYFFTQNLVGLLARSSLAEGGGFSIRSAAGEEVTA